MVLIAFRHGLRASELVDLRWEQVDLKGGVLHVRRVKQGSPATHPLTGRELRALRRLEREAAGSPFVFVSERGAPFSTRGFQAMVERAGKAAGFDMKIHPHMLRHACGYNWRTMASIRARSRAIWATGRSSTRCVILSWRQCALKACLETKQFWRASKADFRPLRHVRFTPESGHSAVADRAAVLQFPQ